MSLRDQVKAEVDKVEDELLDILYRTILALETPASDDEPGGRWRDFVASTYGCTRDAPLGRGEQGAFELRDPLG